MKKQEISIHPKGESNLKEKELLSEALEVDTFDGKLHIEWEPNAHVTTIGQLPFFIQYLKVGQRFEPWVKECPLTYSSNNAPAKVDVLGTLLLSILSGHKRYSHITTLLSDNVNSNLLGMNKIVSDDSARRGLQKISEEAGVDWLQNHLYSCYEPLLKTPWILDTDVTIKPLYGNQEGAIVGYNPHKPGRPSQTYHTYLIANLRLVLDTEVQSGAQTHSNYSLPGLISILDRLPSDSKPSFIRGDCDWGNNKIMKELEDRGYRYLFKLRKSKKVKSLINKHHCKGNWSYFNDCFEAKEDIIKLSGWEESRRVIIVRRRLSKSSEITLELNNIKQLDLSFIDGPEDMKLYEYSVLVTNLDYEIVSIVQSYRDRADCENYFDEIKNQWGWGGYTTKELKSCRFISRIIALVYNWWTLFVRLSNPNNHLEAITSKPLLLSSIGKLTQSGRQKRMVITSTHAKSGKLKKICAEITRFFNKLKTIAPQLTARECWEMILARALRAFPFILSKKHKIELLIPT